MAKLKKSFPGKKILKLSSGGCRMCGETEYSVLDVHRIVPGSAYTCFGSVVLCCRCHRLVHAGLIEIKGRFSSTDGDKIHWIDENKQEHFT